MSIASIGASNRAFTPSTTKRSEDTESAFETPKSGLSDGILDGAVYGALATVLLGPIFTRVPSSNRAIAAIGTIAANAAIFAGLDAIRTDRSPEELDQFLKF